MNLNFAEYVHKLLSHDIQRDNWNAPVDILIR